MKWILLPILALTLAFSSASAGPRVVGNGGDAYALQFIIFAQKVLLYLQNSNIKGLDTLALAKIIESAKVESTTRTLTLDGMTKDAINYPSEQRIVFNRDRWVTLLSEERLALVLHEYLGLLGVEQANYEYSKLLLKDMTTIQRIRPGSDNTWILCQDDGLVVNILEHRSGADGRTTNITLLLGGWVLEGQLEGGDSGPVVLREKAGKGSFAGDVAIFYSPRDDEDHKLTLVGVMTLFQNVIQVSKTLKCQSKYGNE